MLKRLVNPQLTVPAKIDFLGELRDFVSRIGRVHGYSEKVVNAFKLAVDEAATNIIRHAYQGQQGFITVRAEIGYNHLTLLFIDRGIHFDPESVQNPDLEHYVNIGKKGGLGIFIIRKLMDEIYYHRNSEGNILKMTKYCDASYKRNFLCAISSVASTLHPRYLFRVLI